jgi:ribulose-5-phosphate 4-epimerase/fuculose-1-phosphate aldolase
MMDHLCLNHLPQPIKLWEEEEKEEEEKKQEEEEEEKKKRYGRNALPKSATGHGMFMSQPHNKRHCSHFHPL